MLLVPQGSGDDDHQLTSFHLPSLEPRRDQLMYHNTSGSLRHRPIGTASCMIPVLLDAKDTQIWTLIFQLRRFVSEALIIFTVDSRFGRGPTRVNITEAFTRKKTN
jgi:hypothetical protein